MGDSGFQELDPMAAMQALGLLAASLGIIGVVSVRLWAGPDMQDYPGRKPQQILADRRVRLTSGLVLIAAWATVVIGLVRRALRRQFHLDLAGEVHALEGLVLADIAGNHFLDLLGR